jgi:hypothetical protein
MEQGSSVTCGYLSPTGLCGHVGATMTTCSPLRNRLPCGNASMCSKAADTSSVCGRQSHCIVTARAHSAPYFRLSGRLFASLTSFLSHALCTPCGRPAPGLRSKGGGRAQNSSAQSRLHELPATEHRTRDVVSHCGSCRNTPEGCSGIGLFAEQQGNSNSLSRFKRINVDAIKPRRVPALSSSPPIVPRLSAPRHVPEASVPTTSCSTDRGPAAPPRSRSLVGYTVVSPTVEFS